MNRIIPILLMTLLVACSQKQEEEEEEVVVVVGLSEIILINTFNNELVVDTATALKPTIYHPLYIGKSQKKIALEYVVDSVSIPHYYPMETHQDAEGNNILKEVYYRNPNTRDLRIFVDTSKIISTRIVYVPPPSNIKNKLDFFHNFHWQGKYKSHPVFIENLSDDTLSIGLGNRIFPVLEAKDSLDNWRPIESEGIYFCGMGLQHFYLEPKYLIITSCKLYGGNYKTKLRLAYYGVHSNEFEATINYSQFSPLE